MTDSQGRRVSRRRVLHGSAVAGIVWTTPLLRTSLVQQAAGSPPPTSTTATTAPVESFAFDGPFTATGSADFPDAECFAIEHLDASAEFTTLGPSTATFDFCVQSNLDPPPAFIIPEGTFSIDAADGTVSGTVVGGTLEVTIDTLPVLALHLDLLVEAGTGAFAGAIGTAVVDGSLDDSSGRTAHGTMTGTFERGGT